MNEEAREDLEIIAERSDDLLRTKYIRGNEEHGGDILDMTLKDYLLNALDENTDQRVYLLKALERIEEMSNEEV